MTGQDDGANGYEAAAEEFCRRREASTIGVAVVRRWASELPAGTELLDLGCGSGAPIALALHEDGFMVSGIDASPTLIAAFHQRFPEAAVACEAVASSDFFGRRFDGVLAVGLLFLLPAESQREVIRKVAAVLHPGGRFLFTAPSQECRWIDVLTGRESQSLGAAAYHAELISAGFSLAWEAEDEGGNHYFTACLR